MKRTFFLIIAIVFASFGYLGFKKFQTSQNSNEPERLVTDTTNASMNTSLPDVPQFQSHPSAEKSENEDSPLQVMVKIKEAAVKGEITFEFLSHVLSGNYPKNVKFMALQAFHQVHWSDASEIYKNTPAFIRFIDQSLPEMDKAQREVISRLLERLNDTENPKREAAIAFIDEKFEQFRSTDKDKAALFLNAHTDSQKVYDVMKDTSDPELSKVAQNRLPHIAQPIVIKEIISNPEYSEGQKLAAFQRLASGVDGEVRGNNLTDADALLILAKDLDKKNGTGDKFYKAAYNGFSSSGLKNKDTFLVKAVKLGLQPLKTKAGTLGHSKVPELAAMFGYLTAPLPQESTAYPYLIGELDRIAREGQCANNQADYALTDFISFWQNSCEMGDDCKIAAEQNRSYQSIKEKYDQLKKRCPGIG